MTTWRSEINKCYPEWRRVAATVTRLDLADELLHDTLLKILESDKETADKRKAINEAAWETTAQLLDSLGSISDSYFENQTAKIELQDKKDSEAKEKELERAGDNAEVKESIEKRYEALEKKREKEKHEIELKKAKWETIIKKWTKKYLRTEEKDVDQWVMTNRRMSMLSQELFIPSEMEMEEDSDEKDRIQVWFFQDTSGSCSGFRDRFFKAAESLPKERFDIKMHCFDTEVYETTLKSRKLYGFGGTSFSVIEQYIINYINKHKEPYPEAVFVITDGFSNSFSCKKKKPKTTLTLRVRVPLTLTGDQLSGAGTSYG